MMVARKAARARARRTSDSTAPVDVPVRDAFEEYNRLVDSVDLLSVTLLRTECEVHPERMPASEENLRLVTPLPQYRWGVGDDGATLHAAVRHRLQVVTENGDGEKPILQVVAEYSVSYTLPSARSYAEPVAQEFASKNGAFNTWPFFRELVNSMVARMGMPPLIVPFLKLPPRPPGSGRQEFR